MSEYKQNDNKLLLTAMRFPVGIMYKEWLKLTIEQQLKFWNDHPELHYE